jgi:hypothetical protein
LIPLVLFPLVLPSPVRTATVGTAVTWAVGVAVAVVVALQIDFVIVFASSVTAPLRANARPSTTAPVLRWTSVSAMMVPTNLEPVLSAS